jgi:hypothetical protein
MWKSDQTDLYSYNKHTTEAFPPVLIFSFLNAAKYVFCLSASSLVLSFFNVTSRSVWNCSWNIQYNDIVYDTDVLYKNRESISDATAELQVKIIWSCFINK